ncbi:Heme oxygenase-like, multi-helical isoform 1 [Hibiscus syriacus]|uniref:Heme oxygenase-like, multi-helical isoform 1 n=1 Tax=Hibiscus syriacus TaxID=106335 RepID=A0A6A3CRC6_HIBSY|nr:uncharacterized protein LOC120148337 [Hibiscus syriacus]XP_039017433.1 uncharacterized protein LOC120148337 [Hibiscus syriacus]KAE8731773.1 Heme oxygenase-like, multi-helical isoform 1 [Hibiscus syriacus]
MATQLHHFLLLPSPPLTSLPLLNLNKSLAITSTTNNILRCNSTGFPRTDGRSRFDPQNSNDEDDEDEFEFSSGAKQRIWWSDFDDYDDVWELDEDDEFWVFKVFRAFGWMLPAIAISLLLGTGPNAFIMALAVPLGQSALSLVFDKVSGRTSKSWKSTPRRRTKKKQFTRAAANNTRTNKGKRESNKNGEEKTSYNSWLNSDGGLRDKGGQRVPKYGGWDQLDDQVETQKRGTSQKGSGVPKQRKEGKFSRIGRVRDTPLLLRLLIAVFPFLGSWTRFLF